MGTQERANSRGSAAAKDSARVMMPRFVCKSLFDRYLITLVHVVEAAGGHIGKDEPLIAAQFYKRVPAVAHMSL
jgi:hypothetical protein